ncbi:hypothetical protein JKF63_01457 [Porcisia hertigi]|uniref:Uncharacterized protein n=1 Tax=Porcisia hertigi TaxID=2761500 RepID=A0A836L0N4_9TRYP|nr:hypothetical protein JKF63_01457 [Porcisia hertigi]
MFRCHRVLRPFVSPKARLSSLSRTSCVWQAPAITCRHYHNDPSSAEHFAATSSLMPPRDTSSTYLDYVDCVWNSKWFGTVDESAAAAMRAHVASTDPSLLSQAFLSCQAALGMEAGTLIFLAGALTRLCTLFPSLYGERAAERMRLALPELKKPQEDFNRVYFNDLASAMDVQVAASALKSHRRAAFRKFKTSNLKCIASLGMAPFVMTGLYQVSSLCENAALAVGTSSYLWCNALTLPDPYLVLPMLTCVITLLNFELSLSKDLKTGWMRNIIWGARLGCLCVAPVVGSFSSGVCLYLIGMNAVGLLQPSLLRSASVRRWLSFPSAEQITAATPHRKAAIPPAPVKSRTTTLRGRLPSTVTPPEDQATAGKSAKATSEADDVLQASMTAQFPYLSHLLNPQVDEQQDLFAKAPSKQAKRDFSRHALTPSDAAPARGSRYARGVNPLIQEVPLHRQTGSPSHALPHEDRQSGVSSGTAGSSGGVSGAVPAIAGKRAPKPKGSTFASSGWKSTQLSFAEEDFIPPYPNVSSSHASLSSSSQPRK